MSSFCCPGSVHMEKGFATLGVNATQEAATLAVRIWFGLHAWVMEGPASSCRLFLDDGTPFGVSSLLEPLCMRISWFRLFRLHGKNGSAEGKTGQKTKLYTPGNHCAPRGCGYKVVIQSALTGEVTNQLKGQLWQDIAGKVSNCGVCLQTSDQVREKFSNIKK